MMLMMVVMVCMCIKAGRKEERKQEEKAISKWVPQWKWPCFELHELLPSASRFTLSCGFFWWQCSYDSSVHRLLPPPLHTDTLPIGSTLTEKEEIMFKKIKKFYICGTQKIWCLMWFFNKFAKKQATNGWVVAVKTKDKICVSCVVAVVVVVDNGDAQRLYLNAQSACFGFFSLFLWLRWWWCWCGWWWSCSWWWWCWW